MLPYDLHYQHPLAFGTPRIYGVPVRTEILATHETVPADSNGAGRWVEFAKDGVVTGLSLINPADGAWDLTVDILKNGKEHLTTDGEGVQRLSPADINQAGIGYRPVWIPVNSRDKLFVDWLNEDEQEERVCECAFRVEYFLDKPIIPDGHRLTTTRFYRRRATTVASTFGAAESLDFERNGVATALRAAINSTDDDITTQMRFDLLRDGTHHLTSNGRNASPVSAVNLVGSPGGIWLPVHIPVEQRRCWEVFPTNDNAVDVDWDFLVQVEEYIDGQ